MARFSWLHLTDFHFGLEGQKTLWSNLRDPFFDDLAVLHETTGPWQAVFFTGDLVQQGKSAEFIDMQKEVLERLWEKLKELQEAPIILLAVPGNHDLVRPDPTEDNSAVDRLLEDSGFKTIAKKFWDNPSGSYGQVIIKAFGAYNEWWKNSPHRPKHGIKHGILPGDFAYTLEHEGHKIGIVGLNTAFLQLQGGDYKGKLVWDAQQLAAVCGDIGNWVAGHEVCLLLTHQGPDWLSPDAQKHGESEIAPAGRFALHLFGHMHETGIDYIRKGGNRDATRLLQGCSVFGMEWFGEPPTEKRSHGFAVGQIEFNENGGAFRLWPRIATNKNSGWRFVPDHVNVILEKNEATAPELLPLRNHKPATTDTKLPNPTPSKPSAYSNLPSRRPFFGRAKELAIVAECLNPEHTGWGVLLDGPGGIGKTALALEAAHRAPGEVYPLKLFVTAKRSYLEADGTHDIHDGRVGNYYDLLVDIGLGLGREDIRREPRDSLADLVRHALAGRNVLLVLDNLESFESKEQRWVFDWLNRLPAACRAIVTSRRSIVTTSAYALRLDKLDLQASGELLDELGKHQPAIAKLSPAERETLYNETGGNPLLLTWTAGQLGRTQGRCRTVAEAVERLQEAHRRQQLDPNNDPLEFIFGDLLDTFSAAETAVLAALSYFTEPAKLDWLLPLSNLSPTAAQTALDDLRNRALLVEDDAAGTWFLPPLAGRFLRQRRPEAVSEAGDRLAEEAYALVKQFGGESDKAPFTSLEEAWPRVEPALPLLIAGDNARLQAVCVALDFFLEFSGRWDLGLDLSRDAEAKAVAAKDLDNAGWRAYRAGMTQHRRGGGEEVLQCAERCAQHWQQAGTGTRNQAIAIRLRGLGYKLQKVYPQAIAAYEEALKLCRGLSPESEDVAIGLNSLAGAKREAKDWDGAEADFREALRIARKIGHKGGIATYTGNLAELALDREDWPAAEQLARESLGLAEILGRKELIASDHHTLAKALLRQNRAAAALDHARLAVELFTPLRCTELDEARATLAACEAAVAGAVS